MTAFTDWLEDTSQERVLLMDIDAWTTGSPAVVTRRYASRTFITGAGDTPANAIYYERIVGDPFFERQMPESYGGRSFISLGTIELSNPDGDLDTWIDDSFSGRAVVLRLGSPDWTIDQFGTILTGVVDHIEFQSDETIAVVIRDQSKLFDAPIQENLISTGSPQVPAEQEDQPIPLCYGYAYNVRPAKIPLGTSPQTYKYQVHDGAVEDVCVQLYDKGAPSAIGVTKDNANGTFTLASAPTGEITCDVKGAKPSTWLTTPGEIITELASKVGATVNAASMTALDSAAPYELGIYISQRTNAADVIDSILPAGWYWGDGRDGEIRAALLAPVSSPASPVMTIDEVETQGDIQVTLLAPIFWQVRVGYQRNHTVTTSPDDAATEDRKEFLALEYRSASAEDTSVQTQYLDALAPDQYKSHITGKADALTEAGRLLTLYKSQRVVYNLDCFVGPYQLVLGDAVTLTDTRFGLSGGVDCIVIGITEHLLDNRVSLTLWR